MTSTEGTHLWTRATEGRRGPRRRHDLAEIVAAAIAIADERGLSAVSMRAVAVGIDASAPALYRYLSTREDLVDLMLDHVTGEIAWRPGAGGGLDDVVELACAMRAVHIRHPWMREALAAPRTFGPRTTALVETYLSALVESTAPSTHKMELFAVITSLAGLNLSDHPPATDPFPLADADGTPTLVGALSGESPAPRDPMHLFRLSVSGVAHALLHDVDAGRGGAAAHLPRPPRMP